METAPPQLDAASPPVPPGQGAPAAVGAVAAALAAGELVAGVVAAIPSLVTGVATFVIDTVPQPIREWAIETFGTADKLVLGIGIVVVALVLGALIGHRLRDRPQTMSWVFLGFGVAAALAASRSPSVDLGWALVAGLGTALAGIGVYRWLRSRGGRPVEADAARRRLLVGLGAVAALSVAAAAGGRALMERTRRMVAGRDQVVLPLAGEQVGLPPVEASLVEEGISPLVTPNADFYRIDTVPFSVPRVDLASWRMKITGMVGREIELDYTDLLDMPMVERYVTLTCVSNEVGGRLIGTAKWVGVPLDDLLSRALPAEGAEQIVGRSVDGFTVGFPLETAFDGRNALVAVGMNDEPLPFDHGFPARLVVAGLYGYVSATKWLSEIELTTWDGFDAYWIPRGWAKEAPIKTQSRIDTPRHRHQIEPGTRAIAGVAWAPNRGISKVEVQIDDDPWQEAELAASLSDDTWRQWRIAWDTTPGSHTLRVRATDGDGITQDERIRRPAPDGATGYHTISVDVV